MNRPSFKKISGPISKLAVHAGEEEFIRSAGQQSLAIGVAAGLAAIGVAGAAAGAGIVAASSGDAVEFFSCFIGDQLVQGRFSKVSFKDGDHVEAVISNDYLVLALQRPNDQSLWLTPHCSRGARAHRRFCCLLLGKVFLCLMLIGSMFVALMEYSTSATPFKFIKFDALLIFSISSISAIYYSVRFFWRWLPTSRHAEAIFRALGYANPSDVDLEHNHKLYCKSHHIKWPYLSDGPWIYRYPNQ